MLHGALDQIDRLISAERLWLFLDYDGTMADFAPTPDDILPDPELIGLVSQLALQADIKPAIISGRRLDHVRALMPVPGILLAGTYGVEYLTPGGDQINRLDFSKTRPTLDLVKPEWEHLILNRKGFYLEDKRWSLALHARLAADQDSVNILDAARTFAAKTIDPAVFRILGGHKFLEVGPQLANKGETINFILEQYPWDGSLPVYIGDDDKDEEAFSAITEHGGIAILVANEPRETQARLRLESPQDVRVWLEQTLMSRQSPDQ
ncbi:trehalose-phosphatase [Chloroflexota bacterium]